MTIVETGHDLTPRIARAGLSAVLCGSFRRDPEGLQLAMEQLRAGFDLLAPGSIEFVDPTAEFVRLADESSQTTMDIEDRHLAAITHADFVWLHAPQGYVGTSAALELGHARAMGVPVFSAHLPTDEMLAAYVTVVDSPSHVPEFLVPNPGQPLSGLQAYYERIAARRGWAEENPTEILLLLTEELGELAREVRKARGIHRDQAYTGNLGHEIADVQLYLVHLANTLGVDIADAVTSKEQVNQARHEQRAQTNVA